MILFRDSNTGELCCCDDFSEPQTGIFHVAQYPDPKDQDDENMYTDDYVELEDSGVYDWPLDANYR